MKFGWVISCVLLLAVEGQSAERGKGWYGEMPTLPGDEKFQRIYVEDATLYHEDGSEVALWGVNFQSAMSWEWAVSRRYGKGSKRYDKAEWKAMVDRSFDEIQQMGSQVIRIHLCPGDLADAEGNLVETDWLDMLDYTLSECHQRGIYVYLALLNHLGGRKGDEAILNQELKEHKWEAMVVPQKLEATDRYIRQLVNRKNPYDNGRVYKTYPGWIIAEVMNEPNWPKDAPSKQVFPDGVGVYVDWLAANGKQNGSNAWKSFRTEMSIAYINRMDALLVEEQVPAVTCWNLFWSQGPMHQGWESFNAAAESTVPMVSFSTYPGQNDSQKGKSRDLSEQNYLPYLKRSYQDPEYQGWLQEDRFKGEKAVVVYEYETWHNQSTYMYPAMAKYFRAQGAQVATMWTYYLYDNSKTGRARQSSHNLNMVTTPRKAASFLVAKEIFQHTPRYISFETTEPDADQFGHAALSFPEDLSAFATDERLVHTGDLNRKFIQLPRIPKKIAGYGSSPFIQYKGKGMYFIEAVFEEGTFSNRWNLRVMPHAVFDEEGQAVVNREKAFAFTMLLPGMDRRKWAVYRIEGEKRSRVKTKPPAITFHVAPGDYEIIKR